FGFFLFHRSIGVGGFIDPVVVVLRLQALAPADAGGGGERGGRRQSEGHGEGGKRPFAWRSQKEIGQTQNGVADEAAGGRRQRPGRGLRQARGKRGGKQNADNPEQEPRPMHSGLPMSNQPAAPDHDRQYQHDGGNAEELHHQVGGDGAGRAEQ